MVVEFEAGDVEAVTFKAPAVVHEEIEGGNVEELRFKAPAIVSVELEV